VTDKTCSCRFTASGAAFNSAPIWTSSIVIGCFTAVLLHAAPIISQGRGRGEREKMHCVPCGGLVTSAAGLPSLTYHPR
jgi:putative Mn2+ efflux pump MntP